MMDKYFIRIIVVMSFFIVCWWTYILFGMWVIPVAISLIVIIIAVWWHANRVTYSPLLREDPCVRFDDILAVNPILEGDIHVVVRTNDYEVLNGCNKAVTHMIRVPCNSCSGTGAGTNGSASFCVNCDGKGFSSKHMNTPFGGFGFTKNCKICKGRGAVITNPCDICEGTGAYVGVIETRFAIPAGYKYNNLVVYGMGNFKDEKNRSDLIVTLNNKHGYLMFPIEK